MADDDVGAKLSLFAVFWRQPKNITVYLRSYFNYTMRLS